MENKNFIRILIGTGLILLIPLIAMQFSDEVVWTFADFVVMGSLLISTGLIYEFFVKKISNPKQKIALTLALVLALLYVWAELAVGVFTNLGN